MCSCIMMMHPPTHILNIIILFLFFMDPSNIRIFCHSKPIKNMTRAESESWEQQFLKLVDFDASGKGSKMIITVDKNPRNGNFTSIQHAIDYVPVNNRIRVIIIVHAGVYTEKVTIPATKPCITIQGAGRKNTIVQWGDTAGTIGPDGYPLGTYNSATFGVNSQHFAAKNITFKNTTPLPPPELEGKQAVALRISADKALFLDCMFLGAQDTLFDDKGRHYYQDCYIEGSVDFIFGRARSLFKGCTLHAIGPKIGALAAHRRSSSTENTGFSFVNCRVEGNAGAVYLGRAWGRFSRIVYSKTYMDNIIIPEGWSDWNDSSRHSTVFYGQYKCSGPGASLAKRAPWSKVLTDQEAEFFTSINYIDGLKWSQCPHNNKI